MSATASGTRVEYVDRLRGLAVLGMFFVHSGYAWLTPEDKAATYGRWVSQISGMVAPVFMFLAGVAVAIVADGVRRRGDDEARARRRIALRGLTILALGYGLHLAFWALDGFHAPWQKVLKVDVLHCIGVALAVLPWVAWPRRRLSWPALVAFGVLVLGAQLTWRLPLASWLPDPVAGYFTRNCENSLFPAFPYAGWVALGLFVGPLWQADRREPGRERRFWIGIAAAVVGAVAVGFGIEVLYYASGLDRLGSDGRVPITTVHFFFYKAAVVLTLFLIARITDAALARSPVAPLVLLGRTSLFAYCVHLALIYHLFGRDWSRALSPPRHGAGAGLLALLMLLLCLVWYRYLPRGWLLRLRRGERGVG
jgi:uncharacterized membrane protein